MRNTAIIVCLLWLVATFLAWGGSDNKNDVMAGFIVDLAKNVEWPAGNNQDSIIICVVGDSTIMPGLRKAAEASAGKGQRIAVKYASIEQELEYCHIIYIGTDSLLHLAKVLKKVKESATLTVSAQKEFARYGVMVNIREIKNNNIIYAVNRMAARAVKLKIDPQLLKKAAETFG